MALSTKLQDCGQTRGCIHTGAACSATGKEGKPGRTVNLGSDINRVSRFFFFHLNVRDEINACCQDNC